MKQNVSAAKSLHKAGLHRLFQGLEHASGILAAVSGGSDSVGMLALLAQWRTFYPHIPLECATVDHGLREGAAEEAQHVAQLCAGLVISHTVLHWQGEKPHTGLEAAAREARYALLCNHARAKKLSHLVTAHTLEDQAETLLLRLAAGSGFAGLAAMWPHKERNGIVHCRPLLGLTRGDLENAARQANLAWRHDPMNDDPRFARVRLRQSRAVLEREGLTAERLALLARRVQRAEEALEKQTQAALDNLFIQQGSVWACDAEGFMALPDEIALRVLQNVMQRFTAPQEFMRLAKCEALLEALREGFLSSQSLARTLMGIKFVLKTRQKRVVLCLEKAPLRRKKGIATLS